MGGRLRFAPCPQPGCPETAADCEAHRPKAWAGRNGSTRRAALGLRSNTEWDRLAHAALRRDGGRCLRCGGEATHVDHLVPTAWRTPPRDFGRHLAQLGALCEPCHDIKTKAEARLGRLGRPTDALVISHLRWWLTQLQGGARAH